MANRKWLVNLDLNQNQLITPVLDPRSAQPGSPVVGQLFFDTDDERAMEYRTGAWHFIGETDISQSAVTATTLTLQVSTGTYANTVVLNEATVSNAGLLGASLWTLLDALNSGLDPVNPIDDIVKFSTSDLLAGGPIANPQADWFLNGNVASWASASQTQAVSQQSIKDYVDAQVAGGVNYQGGYNADTDTPALETTPGPLGILKGWMYTVTVSTGATFFGEVLEVGDVLIAENDAPTTGAEWTIVQKNETGVVSNASGVGTDNHVTMFDGDGNNIQDAGFLASDVILASTLASETAKGIVEEATQAQMNAGTDTGETGARLFVPPSKIIAYVSAATDLAKYTALVGNNVASSFVITHGLNALEVTMQMFEVATGDQVDCRMSQTSTTTCTVEFNNVPATNEYRIVVIG